MIPKSEHVFLFEYLFSSNVLPALSEYHAIYCYLYQREEGERFHEDVTKEYLGLSCTRFKSNLYTSHSFQIGIVIVFHLGFFAVLTKQSTIKPVFKYRYMYVHILRLK